MYRLLKVFISHNLRLVILILFSLLIVLLSTLFYVTSLTQSHSAIEAEISEAMFRAARHTAKNIEMHLQKYDEPLEEAYLSELIAPLSFAEGYAFIVDKNRKILAHKKFSNGLYNAKTLSDKENVNIQISGGKIELLVERVLHEADTANTVTAHMKASRKPVAGAVLHMDGGFTATVLGRWPDAHGALFRLQFSADPYALMAQYGHVPLPPYITHADDADDERRYQTVFARNPGAVAAPTAALHFDEAMLARLDALGVARASVTLHVGAGTFQPVKTEQLSAHVMHSERYHVPAATIGAIAACRARGGRVVAVGTTSVRALESWASTGQASGETCIFITPGFRFAVVDMLLTNFHLPQSTLLMLVSAFSGHGHIMALYRHAIAQRYRFFSYGDAMLLRKNIETA